jgi:hypothetical protein
MGDYARHRLPEMMAALRQAVHAHGGTAHDMPKRVLRHG